MVIELRRGRRAVRRESLEPGPDLTLDEKVDAASRESFPASDSPGWMSGGFAPVVAKRRARRTRILKAMNERDR